MKISQIVKEKRKHLGLTQENIAEYLGVSTPAVSKWENGVSQSKRDCHGQSTLTYFFCTHNHTLTLRRKIILFSRSSPETHQGWIFTFNQDFSTLGLPF